ncbi:MAG: maleylacetoacetate isomerase [Gammaproteobacteria bacterium]|nr:maleylacetoacetate isomerase [Gammaproteobacteria bacterium]
MKLYTYYRSTAAWRVRIALHVKDIDVEAIPVALTEGEQSGASYLAINPQGLVPALDTGAGVITESLAIIEWLEDTHPQPPLLPATPLGRAQVRAMAQLVACDIHPLNNLRVLNYLRGELAQPPEQVQAWYAHWIGAGLAALEQQAKALGGRDGYLFGDQLTLADVCLVPQLYNARRFSVSLADYPRLCAIEARCLAKPAFTDTAPDTQPDTQKL